MTGPRLAFLGLGWIGLHRMQALLEAGAQAAAVGEPSAEARDRALALAPRARIVEGVGDLDGLDLDGVVIATPSALHAEQAIAALRLGLAVFCQKPLGRTAAEALAIVEVAAAAGRPLGVDLSYRGTRALRVARDAVARGELGRIFAADLVFHNAYGPDKAWFRDPAQSGGGCVIDLGTHLVDALLWVLDHPGVAAVRSRLVAAGRRLPEDPDVNEDFAVAEIELDGGPIARLACSWNLHAGCEAVIEMSFWGTAGAVRVRNVAGSFYDFVAERCHGTSTRTEVQPPDAWGGRMSVEWLELVRSGGAFDAREAERLVAAASVLDRIYGREVSAARRPR